MRPGAAAPAIDPAHADAFIRDHTRVQAPPLTPELRFHLAEESVAIWGETEEALGRQGLPPPFWAFAWAGGQALGRWLLDHPHAVAGRRVLDFGAGCGIAGVAAATAGAAHVTASEIDPFAVAAIRANAALNAVDVAARHADLVGADEGWDLVLAGDVAYEAGPTSAIFDWLGRLSARGAVVLAGDPGRSFLPVARLERLAAYDAPVTRDLEDRELRNAKVWRLKRPA